MEHGLPKSSSAVHPAVSTVHTTTVHTTTVQPAVHPNKIKQVREAIEHNRRLIICGPSGCGKTTLVHHLCPDLIEIATMSTVEDFCDGKHTFAEYLDQIRQVSYFQPKSTLLIEDLPLLWTTEQQMDFKRVIESSRNKIIILYNSSLTHPYEMHKYQIEGMVQIWMNPVADSLLRQVIKQQFKGFIPKETKRYLSYAQGDIRQLILAVEHRLVNGNSKFVSLYEYTTHLLFGSTTSNTQVFPPNLLVPYVQYNTPTAFARMEDIATALEWCSEHVHMLNRLESDAINEPLYAHLASILKPMKKTSGNIDIVNPFKQQHYKQKQASAIAHRAPAQPLAVSFSDDDSIEDEP